MESVIFCFQPKHPSTFNLPIQQTMLYCISSLVGNSHDLQLIIQVAGPKITASVRTVNHRRESLWHRLNFERFAAWLPEMFGTKRLKVYKRTDMLGEKSLVGCLVDSDDEAKNQNLLFLELRRSLSTATYCNLVFLVRSLQSPDISTKFDGF